MTLLSRAELRDVLVEVIAGATGRPEHHWRAVIGDVEKLPLVDNLHSNWSIAPSGSADDLAIVARAVDIVRAEHPYIAA